jgi:hypothetical protein
MLPLDIEEYISGNQITRYHEKQIDTDKTAGHPSVAGMKQNNCQNGNCTQAINIRNILFFYHSILSIQAILISGKLSRLYLLFNLFFIFQNPNPDIEFRAPLCNPL